MRRFSFASLESSHDDRVLLSSLSILPLLELDKNRSVLLFRILARQDEVNALGRPRDVILDRHASIRRNFSVIQYAIHVLERIHPRINLPPARAAAGSLPECLQDNVAYVITHDVGSKLPGGGGIDDHLMAFESTVKGSGQV